MKTAAELKEIAQFIAEYATRLMGSGVHTSRVVRNSKRLGEALGVRVIVSAFQKVVTFFGLRRRERRDIQRGGRHSAPADQLRTQRRTEAPELGGLRPPGCRFRKSDPLWGDHRPAAPRPDLHAHPRRLANASFCRLFGGDWFAVSIVFTATLLGFFLRQRMQARGFNHFLIFIASSFAASMCAFGGADVRPHVGGGPRHERPLPHSGRAADQRRDRHRRGHILIGFARLTSALMLIVCIAIGLS